MKTPVSLPTDDPAAEVGPIRITLVTSNGCHFCRDAEELLARLARRFPLRVERINLATPEGADLARRLRVPFPPVLLIDGAYFGHGRISARKLTRALEARTGLDH